MGSFRQVSLTRWFGSSSVHMVPVLCLLILGWILDPSLADPVSYSQFSQLETRPLRLGLERAKEKLPFRGGEGKCVYELMNMKEAHWYEVKISYPASTPAIFGIDLLLENAEDAVSSGRKLLNTEKIIFHLPKGSAAQGKQVGMIRRVLVSVKPEGFVALPFVQEQEFIIYNILLEEVVWGIPLQAFWVGFLGLTALGISVLAARQISTRLQPLPRQLMTKSAKRAL